MREESNTVLYRKCQILDYIFKSVSQKQITRGRGAQNTLFRNDAFNVFKMTKVGHETICVITRIT